MKLHKNPFVGLLVVAVALLYVLALPQTAYANGVNKIGDANGDGKVNLKDAILTLQASNGKDIEIDRVATDVTGDGKVNLKDAILILKRANGNKDPFPVELPANKDDDTLEGELGVEDSDF